ncbi:alpha/beta hydrolase [Variovorax sp. ZS18.2.2]|uniref:alpha/beta fold hydrolase n=1 Tax=Variovorax sp. ZS18.2.2 TaxID=2971255 RepID=UPI002150B3EB|nr:alpha/beta fold hydrolase [Variovorax sp. ZS18.2.2]MCR6480866.1 alpha/beta hydrolase [Variovorax sp. ZS18.2.2]
MALETHRLPYLCEAHRSLAVVVEGAGVFRQRTATTDDDVRLAVFEAGDERKPTVLLVNALGISVLFMAALAKRLARDHHVVTWESRGLPDFDAFDPEVDLSIRQQALDAVAVLPRPAKAVHAIVAFCSGANIAAYAVANGLLDTQRLCLISPSIELPDALEKSDYQRTMLPLWPKVVTGGTRYAALVRALLQKGADTEGGDDNPALSLLNGLPFDTAESTYRYAQLQAACLEVDWSRHLARIRPPTLVLHCDEDAIIHAQTSQAVARCIPGALFRGVPGSGHFGVHTSSSLQAAVAAYLARAPITHHI